MKKMVGKIIEVITDIKTGVNVLILARKYSRRSKGITTQSLIDLYEKD